MTRLAELESRVARLEAELARLHSPVAGPPVIAGPQPPPPRLDQRIGTDPARPPEAAVTRRPSPVVWETESVLKWVGIGLVVLAVGFALSTAISRGWIGPELQLAGAIAFSASLIGAGLRLRSSRPAWTHALCSGGVLALFTTFASNLFLDQASDEVAYALTLLTVVLGVGLAVRVVSQWVAVATVFGSVVAWTVIGRGDPPVASTAGLLVVGAAAVLFLAEQRRWHAVRLTTHGLLLASTLLLAAAVQSGADRIAVLVAAGLGIASMSWLPSRGDLQSVFQQLEVQLATLLGAFAVGTVILAFEIDSDTSRGLVGFGAAAVLTAAAIGLRPRLADVHDSSLLIAASIAASIGVAFLLSTTAVFVALAVQGAGLIVLSRQLGREVRVLANAAVLLGVSSAFVAGATIDAWSVDAAVGDDIAHIAVIAALAAAAWLFWEPFIQKLGALLVLGLTLSWLGSVLVHLPQGQALVSVSWAVVGVAVLAGGAVEKRPELGATGLAVLALTVGKLLTVDLTEVDTLWRAGLFLVVGLGLMRIGFMLPDLIGRGEPSPRGRRQRPV